MVGARITAKTSSYNRRTEAVRLCVRMPCTVCMLRTAIPCTLRPPLLQVYEPRRGFRGYRRDRVLQQHVSWAREQGFVLARGHTLEVGRGVY